MRRAVLPLLAVVLLAVPAAASAATPDLQIISVQASHETVPIGIPTKVTFVVNVRNNGEATTGNTGSIGPIGGSGGSFTTVDLKGSNPSQAPEEPEYCDPPSAENPRCRLPFLQRAQTQQVEVIETVVASAASVTRTFTADVLAPDTDGNGANNRMALTLKGVPGALPTVSKVALRGRSALSAKQRRHAIGKLALTLDRDAELLLTVQRRGAGGTYRYWGEWLREGNAGANSILLSNRIDYRHDPPIDFEIRKLLPGSYRLTIVAIDGDGHKSKAIRRSFVVRRRR